MAWFEMKIDGIEEAKKLVSAELHKAALSKAVFNTAHDAKKELVEEMKTIFDRPTPFILRSVTVRSEGWAMWQPSVYAKTLSLIIGIMSPPMEGKHGGTDPADILRPHIEGGSRSMKPSEQYLGNYWIPGRGFPLNKYGNITGGKITQILSTLGKFPEVGYLANISARSRQRNKKPRNFFMVGWNNKGLHAGVWERMSNGRVKPVLIFIKNPNYYARFKFYEILKKSIERNIQRRYDEALREKTGGLLGR